MSWFDGLLYPIMWVVAWIMYAFHWVLDLVGLDPAGGAAWGLSIVGLVIVMRIILIPLFFRQIKAQRGLQLVQPEMQKIQKKYKGKTDPASREAMSRETMELYRKHGTNPFASCLPILAQSPIFFALFRVLNSLPQIANGSYGRDSVGPITQTVASQAESASIFGAPLSGTFMNAAAFGDGSQAVHIRVVTVVLIIAMSLTTFTTQRQLTMKNMPPAALEGPMAQQQKMLMYVFPLIFAFSGVNFPIGVLIYWTTTNLWTMGQQFYTIRRMPAPGSQAEIALKARKAKKAAARGELLTDEGDVPGIEEARPVGGQRQQPVGKARAKKKGPAGGTTAQPSGASSAAADSPTAAPSSVGGSSSVGAASSVEASSAESSDDEFDPKAGPTSSHGGSSGGKAKKRKGS
ncbi:membrane protein insertase YidC [Cellulomonas sp. NPDC089187]|uniref:membrane protein insertase YidC n=1 Tax=Cellulomonas sp. NPDC089187 TaxID=3154970 RepID=UPI0034333AAD